MDSVHYVNSKITLNSRTFGCWQMKQCIQVQLIYSKIYSQMLLKQCRVYLIFLCLHAQLELLHLPGLSRTFFQLSALIITCSDKDCSIWNKHQRIAQPYHCRHSAADSFLLHQPSITVKQTHSFKWWTSWWITWTLKISSRWPPTRISFIG